MPRQSTIPTPVVYDYLDYRLFLKDWFAAKKVSNPRFSHRMFARRAGQKSPSLLHAIMAGTRNLTPTTTEGFVTALDLSPSDAIFFRLLVALGQAEGDTERNAVWEGIASTRRFRDARKIEGDGFAYLSSWYFPAIRELAHRPDFSDDPEWIGRTLRPKISAAKAKRAVESLLDMGLLVREGGKMRPAEASVVTPHEVLGLAVHNYHKSMLERAHEAIDAFDPEERHLGGVTVAVPRALVPRLKQEIAAFQERVMNLCDTAPEDKDRVYQFNLQLFPLSEPRE